MDDEAVVAARYRSDLRSCTRCPLHAVGSGPVPWSGGLHRDLVCVGEAPGRLEDEDGAPFVGPAGSLLRSVLHDHGIDPSTVGFVNAVSCYPKGTPTQEHVDACAVHLSTQVAVLQPRHILVFGVIALGALLPARSLKLGEVRGRPIWAEEVGSWPVWWRSAVELWPTYHPAAALRRGSYRQMIEEDVAAFVEWRDTQAPYPFTCVTCKGEADHWDYNGLAWCDRHAGRQLSLL